MYKECALLIEVEGKE